MTVMRRVSSRQRLDSWGDQAPGCCGDCDDSAAGSSYLDDQDSSNNKRKRSGAILTSSLPPAVVPAFDWELASTTKQDLSASLMESSSRQDVTADTSPKTQQQPLLIAVTDASSSAMKASDDVWIHILEFCDHSTVRRVSQVNGRLHDLLYSEGSTVWHQLFRNQWNWIKEDSALVVATNENVNQPKSDSCCSNSATSLSLAASEAPTGIDEHLFTPTRYQGSIRRFRTRRLVRGCELIRATSSNPPAYAFTGTVGDGDRCIRANAPLPRPRVQKQNKFFLDPFVPRPTVWIPFVVPHALPGGGYDVSPRLVSYFETTIVARPVKPEQTSNSFDECTAVGLATEFFSLHTRMPGWDLCSYGYHGDDGGTFHNTGAMLHEYGPRFGAGDTVGCGIDYLERAIFYTLNGRFLGYAFSQLTGLDKDWYPVVGMDTKCWIRCNFGQQPFLFDLSKEIIQKQQPDVQRILRGETSVSVNDTRGESQQKRKQALGFCTG